MDVDPCLDTLSHTQILDYTHTGKDTHVYKFIHPPSDPHTLTHTHTGCNVFQKFLPDHHNTRMTDRFELRANAVGIQYQDKSLANQALYYNNSKRDLGTPITQGDRDAGPPIRKMVVEGVSRNCLLSGRTKETIPRCI